MYWKGFEWVPGFLIHFEKRVGAKNTLVWRICWVYFGVLFEISWGHGMLMKMYINPPPGSNFTYTLEKIYYILGGSYALVGFWCLF